ncbi:MAG: S-methyl-5'-thioadenosine phosphorylase [Thermoflavifilum sp.]|nr:S-methyl-5'-thioadenosine phosphorylase [Thermoflavifilum sp.]MCL6513929.1 S-methyl-5'-thioadenosine phosphorylase [Alicyclobacillus sp.]
MSIAEYAIIGGTGVYDPALLKNAETITLDTPYGAVEVIIGAYESKPVAFVPRHGPHHQWAPHRVNYRGNLWALRQLGVTQVLATAAVGSLDPEIAPGTLVLVDDFLDFTKSRPCSFYDEGTIVHVDMSDPYCHRLRQHLRATGDRLGIPLREGGVYVCTEGPRFETKAEIRLYQRLGGSVVGMTSVPEVVLAKELEMCYATVCIVTNYAAGISPAPLTHEEVVEQMRANVHRVRELFFETFLHMDGIRDCRCPHAVGGQSTLGMKGDPS